MSSPWTLRTDLRPGDLGEIVRLHGALYAREHGFDVTFEAYVAGPLAEFALNPSPRARIWLAESGDQLAGCIAIVESSPDAAQLRWFLVDPRFRGQGLGRKLLDAAIAFCRDHSYQSVYLWTESHLTAAARLYTAAGFRRTERQPGRHWGVAGDEEKYVLDIGS